jgi:hypothetical protein
MQMTALATFSIEADEAVEESQMIYPLSGGGASLAIVQIANDSAIDVDFDECIASQFVTSMKF